MPKKDILNLVLLVIVIVLASVIYLSEEKSTALNRLTNLDLNDISSINIHHNKNNTIIVRHKQNQWQITQPINIAANNFRINSLLNLLSAPVHKQYLLTEIDTKTIGLDEPQTSVQFNKLTIDFGITNPATNLRYLKLNNYVYTIEDVFYPLISSHFGTLVSLNLLPANSQIEKLVLPELTIARDEHGLWRSNIEISADNIVKTIQHWQQDQAFGVHKYMQRKKLGEVLIYLENSETPITYIITDMEPWLILARPEAGLEYHLDKEAYNNLVNPAETNKKLEQDNEKLL